MKLAVAEQVPGDLIEILPSFRNQLWAPLKQAGDGLIPFQELVLQAWAEPLTVYLATGQVLEVFVGTFSAGSLDEGAGVLGLGKAEEEQESDW